MDLPLYNAKASASSGGPVDRKPFELRLIVQLLWALPACLFAVDDPASSVPAAPPPAILSGSLQAEAAHLPKDLTLEVSAKPRSRQGWTAGTDAPCAVADNRFTCPVPAGEIDARLRSPGFAPVYRWGLETDGRNPLDLGRVVLRAGASLSGWIVVEDRSSSPAEVAVELRPEVLGWQGNPAERKRSELREHRATVGQNGFFQLTGLSPGEYVLTAQRKGLSPARVAVTIPERAEAALAAPVRLEPLAPLQVWVTPATGLDGTPWNVEILAAVPRTNVLESVTRSAAALDGSWVSAPLPAGSYEVIVRDAAGSDLHRATQSVGSSTPPLFIELDLVPIRGTLTLGDAPLAATLVFGTTNRQPNVRLDADEEGRFQGYLPREGRWPVEILLAGDRKQRAEDVEVERLASGKPDTIEVKLPDTRIAGRVVSRGAPARDAFVVITRKEEEHSRREASLRVDREGRFQALGISPGPVAVRAYDEKRTSRWMDLHLEEGAGGSELLLELGETVSVKGRLVTPHGPAAGGLVVAWAELPEGKPIFLGEAVSAADGSFELSADGRSLGLKILAVVPGCGVEIARFPVPRTPAESLAIACTPTKGELLFRGAVSQGLLVHGGASVEANTLFDILERAGLLAWSDQGPLLQGMPLGPYRLCTAGQCRDGELSPGARLAFPSPVSEGSR